MKKYELVELHVLALSVLRTVLYTRYCTWYAAWGTLQIMKQVRDINIGPRFCEPTNLKRGCTHYHAWP